MGEIADMTMNGVCCAWCQQFFKESHGYPVLCKKCWDNSTPKERAGHQRAIQEEV